MRGILHPSRLRQPNPSTSALDLPPSSTAEALWEIPIPSGQNRYYDGMLYLMSLMHLSGSSASGARNGRLDERRSSSLTVCAFEPV